MAAYVYLLLCGDGSYYTGWTNDLEKRVKQHTAGKGGRYTRAHLPVSLVYAEQWPTKQAAMQREWAMKQSSHMDKEQLAAAWNGKF